MMDVVHTKGNDKGLLKGWYTMSQWKTMLRGQLFGLDRKKVHAYLRKIEQLHDNELTLVRVLNTRQAVQSENDRLIVIRNELAEKRRKENKVTLIIASEEMQMKELEELRQRIQEQKIEWLEIIRLREAYEFELKGNKEAYEREINELEQKTQHYMMQFNDLTVRFNELVACAQEHNMKLNMDNPLTQKEEREERFDPQEDALEEETLLSTIPLEGFNPLSKPNNVFLLKQKPIKQEIQLQQVVTADGLALHELTDKDTIIQSETDPVESHDELIPASLFWGNIGGYINSFTVEEGPITETIESSLLSVPVWSSEIEKPQQADAKGASEDKAAVADKEKEDISTIRPTGSATVSEEISSIRHRYIVGKRAGENLYDNEGQLIINKHAIITPEVVEAVDRIGKLADLIVSMTISEHGS